MTETGNPPLLDVRGVKTYYGKIVALRGVDITVNQGEIVTMIGANGAGKSTLMMTIFGKPQAREGQILFDGRDITTMPTHEIARLKIAQSPEGRRIFPRMTVMENLQMGASVDQGDPQTVRDFISERGISYPIAIVGPDVIRELGGVVGYPTSMLIGRDGRVRHRVMGPIGPLSLEPAIRRALAE